MTDKKPVPYEPSAVWPERVEHLRDRFAMAALTGLLAIPAEEYDKLMVKPLVDAAYEIANEMMARRKYE